MSESRYENNYNYSSESRSSESRNENYGQSSESRREISSVKKSSNDCVDAIDALIDLYKSGKISGDNLANSLKKLNS